jgi:hypothetical protein
VLSHTDKAELSAFWRAFGVTSSWGDDDDDGGGDNDDGGDDDGDGGVAAGRYGGRHGIHGSTSGTMGSAAEGIEDLSGQWKAAHIENPMMVRVSTSASEHKRADSSASTSSRRRSVNDACVL